ncbi:hypothetical protein [Sinorhizobium medicae]|uniref:hypothetical protein n=1 Tax=Sinorhizobium medicae TaxID=110321 RepID=UPI0011A3EF63|nr:hypothetical protein [Sinorhizobium medicae]
MNNHPPVEQPAVQPPGSEVATQSAERKHPPLFGVGNPSKFMVLGVEVGGWGSLLALIVSIVTLLWTAYDKWIVEPDPVMWGPEEVNFACHDPDGDGCSTDDRLYLRANPITFLNNATGNHPYTVRTMDAYVAFKDAAGENVRDLCLDWQYLSNVTTAGAARDTAGPFEVSRETPFVHEIEFFARRKFVDGAINRANLVPFREMEAMIANGGIKSVVMTFEAQVVGGATPLTASCVTPVDDDIVSNAAAHTFSLYARECFVVEPLEAHCPLQ